MEEDGSDDVKIRRAENRPVVEEEDRSMLVYYLFQSKEKQISLACKGFLSVEHSWIRYCCRTLLDYGIMMIKCLQSILFVLKILPFFLQDCSQIRWRRRKKDRPVPKIPKRTRGDVLSFDQRGTIPVNFQYDSHPTDGKRLQVYTKMTIARTKCPN